MKICVTIPGPHPQQVTAQIAQALPYADLFELRCDLYTGHWQALMPQWCQQMSRPWIATCRHVAEGGQWQGTRRQHHSILESLARYQPTYLDLDLAHEGQLFQQRFPQTQLIRSWHDFQGIPHDLETRAQQLMRYAGSLYKLAVTPCNSVQALQLVELGRRYPQLIALGMGLWGKLTRLLAPITRSGWTFAALTDVEFPVPTPLTICEAELYCLRQRTSSSALYGLIGRPIDRSLGHLFHNYWLQQRQRDAFYVKIPLAGAELREGWQAIQRLGFTGLSITMPLKEAVMPLLDYIDPTARAIGAVNTVVWKEGKSWGYTTDGRGALHALEAYGPIAHKTVVVLGAGGAARAVIFEALRQGARVLVHNRTPGRAQVVAAALGATAVNEMPSRYDILINATPSPMPIDTSSILPGSIVMEMNVYPVKTDFLQVAERKGCMVIHGYEMFLHQALAQTALWSFS